MLLTRSLNFQKRSVIKDMMIGIVEGQLKYPNIEYFSLIFSLLTIHLFSVKGSILGKAFHLKLLENKILLAPFNYLLKAYLL